MAQFLLDISGKPGSKVFSDRLRNNLYEKESISGNPDFDFKVISDLDIDPYTDTYWSDTGLETLENKVKKQFIRYEKQIENTVLTNLRKNRVEDWMLPLIDDQRNHSVHIKMIEKLITMIEIAKNNKGTIVFLAD